MMQRSKVTITLLVILLAVSLLAALAQRAISLSGAGITGILPITRGGSGATTASGARTAFGIGSVGLLNSIAISDVTGLQAALDGKGVGDLTGFTLTTPSSDLTVGGSPCTSGSCTMTVGLDGRLASLAGLSGTGWLKLTGGSTLSVNAAIPYGDLSGTPTLGTSAPLNVAASGNAAAGEVVKGNDTRLSDTRTPTDSSVTTAKIVDGNVTGTKLENSGVSAGSCGSATESCVLTVDAKGRVTARSTATIEGGTTVNNLSPTMRGVAISYDTLRSSVRMLNVNNAERALGSTGKSSGKWYFEVRTSSSVTAGTAMVGLTKNTSSFTTFCGQQSDDYAYYGFSGAKWNNNAASAYGATYGENARHLIGVALDLDAGTLVFYKDNVSQGTAFSSLSGTFYPCVSGDASGDTLTISIEVNFGYLPFVYTPPAGFTGWEL